MFTYYAIHSDNQNTSALPNAPVIDEPAAEPGFVSRTAAAGLLGLARAELALARMLDPRRHTTVQTRTVGSGSAGC